MSICYGCMKEIDKEEKVCPYCGFDGNHYATKFYQLKLGTILNDRYVIGKMLGEGGFGITYIGWDRNLEVAVAIKEYYPNGMVNRDTTTGNKTVFTMEGKNGEAFEIGMAKVISEARRMAKFRNLQGIVTVVDFFKENGTAYIVMEYVEGITFKEYQRENNITDANKVVELFKPLIYSLSLVHKQGLIHRDISPDNIMLNMLGEVRLLDFGAARDYGEDEKSLSIMLKRGYAPEEQYRTKGQQGPWTDVYALCATMYKMITGTTPEESLNRMAEDTLKKPSELGIMIDEHVEEVLLKGLAVFKRERIQSMEELYENLYSSKIKDFSKQNNTIVTTLEKNDLSNNGKIQQIEEIRTAGPNSIEIMSKNDKTENDGTVLMFQDNEMPLKSNRKEVKEPDTREFKEIIAEIKNMNIRDCLRFGIYEWVILEKKSGKVLVISKDVLEEQAYNKGWTETTWESSVLREYLNSTFLDQAFSQKEQMAILTTTNINADNSKYKTHAGRNTDDKIFLLNMDEAKHYFENDNDRIGLYSGKEVWWWLRTPGKDVKDAVCVTEEGWIFESGLHVYNVRGIRPAFWLNLDADIK